MSVRFISASEAASLIKDEQRILTVGFTLMGVSEDILKAIERRFLSTSSPRNLTLVHAAGQSDRLNGLEHLAHEGLIKRVIGSHWGLAPKMSTLIRDNRIEGFCLPQGQLVHLFRAMAAGCPGIVSKVGLGTFVDPRLDGGRINECASNSLELVTPIAISGEEYLFYHAFPVDVAIIRGTTADERGNITTEEEAVSLEVLSGAQAAKRYGGIVIAQVKRIARAGTLHPKWVAVPGIFVDYVVVSEDPVENHRQTSSIVYDPVLNGNVKSPRAFTKPIPLNLRKVIGRRAMMELWKGATVNLGTGIPGDVFGPIADEERIQDEITLTVESGTIGGVPIGGVDFGVSRNAEAIIEHPYQFDYYNGAGVDITFMGAAEIDEEGNVNVSKFGDRLTGCGGFIDITQSAKNVVFCTSFTTDGLKVAFDGGKVVMLQEGKTKKFVRRVRHLTFSGSYARKVGQSVLYVTERAVFRLGVEGLVLTEVAPGVDVEKDILNQMDFKPKTSPELKIMEARIFREEPMGLTLSG